MTSKYERSIIPIMLEGNLENVRPHFEFKVVSLKPGEMLITRPLVNKMAEILGVKEIMALGNLWRSNWQLNLDLEKGCILMMEQLRRSKSTFLNAAVTIHISPVSLVMKGITKIRLTSHDVEFIQEDMCHKQSISINKLGSIYSSTKAEADDLQYLR